MTYEFGAWFGRYWAIAHALILMKGNHRRAADLLGIQRTMLLRLLRPLR